MSYYKITTIGKTNEEIVFIDLTKYKWIKVIEKDDEEEPQEKPAKTAKTSEEKLSNKKVLLKLEMDSSFTISAKTWLLLKSYIETNPHLLLIETVREDDLYILSLKANSWLKIREIIDEVHGPVTIFTLNLNLNNNSNQRTTTFTIPREYFNKKVLPYIEKYNG